MSVSTLEAPPEPKPDDIPGITRPMTYEEYLASPEEMARYDIIDGWKVYRLYGAKRMPNPTRVHQEVQGEIFVAFRAFARASGAGKAILAPCDVLIELRPTRSRQPDILFISNERLALNPPANDPEPLSPAPELVVEILSPSDTGRVLTDKLADYRQVDVRECWLVNLDTQSVEVLRLTVEGTETVATYGPGETVASVVFPGLTAAIDTIFAG